MPRRRQKSSRNTKLVSRIARERIEKLYSLAVEETHSGNYKYAQQLMELAKRISMKTRTRIPRKIKRWVCKNCLVPLIPGRTARIRIRRDGRSSRVIVRCEVCGWIHRYPYKPKRRKVNTINSSTYADKE
ncbi:MAG: ribonuclease P [Desulfurococcales archaeon]|nr:ribonuclease P [Desulfurococcales archaeon]